MLWHLWATFEPVFRRSLHWLDTVGRQMIIFTFVSAWKTSVFWKLPSHKNTVSPRQLFKNEVWISYGFHLKDFPLCNVKGLEKQNKSNLRSLSFQAYFSTLFVGIKALNLSHRAHAEKFTTCHKLVPFNDNALSLKIEISRKTSLSLILELCLYVIKLVVLCSTPSITLDTYVNVRGERTVKSVWIPVSEV